MRSKARTAWLVLVGLAPACDRHGVVPERDARRVVAASAGAVDYLCWLGVADRIVAWPAQARRYANGLPAGGAVTGATLFARFRAEPVLNANPGLVVCDWYQVGDTTERLVQDGVEVVVLTPIDSLAGLGTNIERVALALGLDAGAARRRFDREVAALRRQDPIDASVLPWVEFGGGAQTAGQGTIEDLMIALAGARNHARALGLAGHVPLSTERLLAAPPDFFLTGEGTQRSALLGSGSSRPAPNEDRVLSLPARLRNASSPYLVEAARALRAQLRARSR